MPLNDVLKPVEYGVYFLILIKGFYSIPFQEITIYHRPECQPTIDQNVKDNNIIIAFF